MKKIVAAVCTAMLVVSTAVTAFAAGSTSGTVASVDTATDANNNAVSITVEATDQTLPEATLEDVLGDEFNDDLQVLGVQDVTVEGNPTFPVTITFNVAGVTADSKVFVLHYENGGWVKVPATAGDGTITATFSSLSPVAFVVEKVASDNPASTEKPADSKNPAGTQNTGSSTGSTGAGSSTSTTGSSTGAGSSTTSPKTGETSAMMVVALVAVAALGGMVYAKKVNA